MEIEKFLLREFEIDSDFKKKGGEAIVSKAYHPHLGEVAIKEWTSDAYNTDNEIELLKKNCNHPNIIQFVGILKNNQSKDIGYVMPYMPLGSLADVIHNKAVKYDEKQSSSWIAQICCGLSYLHFKKIIHRDIKPSNVLLGKCHDDVKLSDFGMARSLKNINHTLTKLGTPVYMASEIFEGAKYDFSADIYSLSITIWEILHRRIPYDHVTVQLHLPYKISNGERPQLNNNLSVEISGLLKRCWDADPSKRPTIDYVQEFCRKRRFSLVGLENAVNECKTFFQYLNVHNNHHEPLTQIALKTQNEKFHILKPIEESTEEQTILLLGGGNGMKRDSLLMLENNGQNWKQLNIKLPYAVRSHGAQFLNNNIYIFGGGFLLGTFKCTYKLSKSLQWGRVADMNQTRRGISNSSVILNNQIWVCGGQDRKEKLLKSVEMYDPLTNTWKYMKQMNECRSCAAAAVVNGKIFCAGGDYTLSAWDSVEYYDPSSDVWTPICNMPQKVNGHAAVEMNRNLIVMGGCNGGPLNSAWALDTTDKNARWIEKPSMSIPRKYFSIVKIYDKIFICGGLTKVVDYLDSVEIFDGEVWRDGPKMPTSRTKAPAVVIPMSFARSLK